MRVQILAFGIAREIVNKTEFSMDLRSDAKISDLKNELLSQFERFEDLKKFDLAVNQQYEDDDFALSENDEIAIIPPVSGG